MLPGLLGEVVLNNSISGFCLLIDFVNVNVFNE